MNKKNPQWNKGYAVGVKETEKAFGGCTNCYGKGYSTVKVQAGGEDEFTGESISYELEPIVPCKCDRGKQIEKILERIKKRK